VSTSWRELRGGKKENGQSKTSVHGLERGESPDES